MYLEIQIEDGEIQKVMSYVYLAIILRRAKIQFRKFSNKNFPTSSNNQNMRYLQTTTNRIMWKWNKTEVFEKRECYE